MRNVAERVGVMYLGRIIETGPGRPGVRPAASTPTPPPSSTPPRCPIPGRGAGRDHVDISGDVPSPVNLPSGCAFHPRCPIAIERCRSVVPELVPLPDDPGVSVACHRAEERLAGLALPLVSASAPTPAASQEDPA